MLRPRRPTPDGYLIPPHRRHSHHRLRLSPSNFLASLRLISRSVFMLPPRFNGAVPPQSRDSWTAYPGNASKPFVQLQATQ